MTKLQIIDGIGRSTNTVTSVPRTKPITTKLPQFARNGNSLLDEQL